MRRGQNSTDAVIHTMCMLAMTDEKKMAELGGKLLTVFHAVCRHNITRIDNTAGELFYLEDDGFDLSEESKMLNRSLIRLECFMDDDTKDRYEREIYNAFDLSQMIRIMEALKYKVYNYGSYGPELVSVLSTCYMNSFDYSFEEASELLNMSTSSFYRKKKRGEILFGLAFLEYKANIRSLSPMGQGYDERQVSMAI